MRIISLIIFSFLLLNCSPEPAIQQETAVHKAEPLPYLYKIPTTAVNGLAVGRVKKEAFAEAFVSRLSTKKPVGVVVLQEEKLVLEEYFEKDSTAFVCTGPLNPAYTGALLGAMFLNRSDVPYKMVPLQEFYPHDVSQEVLVMNSSSSQKLEEEERHRVQLLDKLVEQQMSMTQGLAAEELLFEPLQIDDYSWQQGSLCLHPHGLLQLGSLWLRRGRWGGQAIVPDKLVQRVLEPAYAGSTATGKKAFGWQYHRLVAKGRKHAVLYWQNGSGAHLFLLPEIEAVVLLQGGDNLMPEALEWMQHYLIPSLTP